MAAQHNFKKTDHLERGNRNRERHLFIDQKIPDEKQQEKY